jgi:hypothetical protein
MGAEQRDHGAWERIRQLAERLESPHADKVYIAKDYTKADLRRDLLASIPAKATP